MKEMGLLPANQKLNGLSSSVKTAVWTKFWQKVDLGDVMKFANIIDETYERFLLKPGSSAAKYAEMMSFVDGRRNQALGLHQAKSPL